MLILCQECTRQFDVSGLAPGQQILCVCGHQIEIPEQKTHEARALHCSGCGGTLQENATHCGYCGGSISVDERQLGQACPKCFARLNKAARFCRECGIEICPQAIKTVPIDAKCPRCTQDLMQCEVPGANFVECTGCGGIWLDKSTFDSIVEDRDKASVGTAITKATTKTVDKELDAQLDTSKVTYLPCPICAQFMHRKNFASCSGVIIDWCKDHGVWFDTHELEKIMDFVEGGGLDRAREKEIQRARREVDRAKSQAKAIRSAPRTHSSDANRDLAGSLLETNILEDLVGFVGSKFKSLF